MFIADMTFVDAVQVVDLREGQNFGEPQIEHHGILLRLLNQERQD
jgi:hypothetical protein